MQSHIADELRDLLDTRGEEEAPLQNFLEEHPEILARTFNQGAFGSTVIPQFKLAEKFVPDFLMIGHRSNWGWDVDMIEIEPAVCKPLFTKNRLAGRTLHQAEGQIKDWQQWMEKHEQGYFVGAALEAVKKAGGWDEHPKYYELDQPHYQPILAFYRIVIGRRSAFQGWGTEYQRRTWEGSGRRIEIVPWDRLVDVADRLDQQTRGLPTHR